MARGPTAVRLARLAADPTATLLLLGLLVRAASGAHRAGPRPGAHPRGRHRAAPRAAPGAGRDGGGRPGRICLPAERDPTPPPAPPRSRGQHLCVRRGRRPRRPRRAEGLRARSQERPQLVGPEADHLPACRSAGGVRRGRVGARPHPGCNQPHGGAGGLAGLVRPGRSRGGARPCAASVRVSLPQRTGSRRPPILHPRPSSTKGFCYCHHHAPWWMPGPRSKDVCNPDCAGARRMPRQGVDCRWAGSA
jgi:hypothetical protein